MKNNNLRTAENRRPVSTPVRGIYRLSLVSRLLLETFLRRNFGKRYYSLRQALFIAFLMLCWFGFAMVKAFPASYIPNYYNDNPDTGFWSHYISWLVFVAVFVFCAVTRKLEASKNNGYSLYMGDHHALFFKVKLFGQKLTPRFIETIGEPLFCLAVGFGLYKLEQPIGILLMVCSAFYSISYICAYRMADEIIMDVRDAGARGDIYRNLPLKEQKPPSSNDVEDVR